MKEKLLLMCVILMTAFFASCEKDEPSNESLNDSKIEIYSDGTTSTGISFSIVDGQIIIDNIKYAIKGDYIVVTGYDKTKNIEHLKPYAIISVDGRDYVTRAIGAHAFMQSESIKSIQLPVYLTSIGRLAFAGCINLESIYIPEGVSDIGNGAFAACENLKSLSIPSSVKYLRSGTFAGCPNLQVIKCYALTPPQYNVIGGTGGVFDDQTYAKANLHVPAGVVNEYKNFNGDYYLNWAYFTNIIGDL